MHDKAPFPISGGRYRVVNGKMVNEDEAVESAAPQVEESAKPETSAVTPRDEEPQVSESSEAATVTRRQRRIQQNEE